jgi:carboxyl-terminal processing protease
LTVDYVFSGSPAEAAGILIGDRILEIDGQPAEDLAATDAVTLIRGEAGTIVNLKLARDGDIDLWDLPIVRDSIRVPSIEARMIDEVGYIAIRGFPGPGLYEDVVSQLGTLQLQGAQSLVIDLRGNSGGRLDVGTRVAALFLPEGTPVYTQTTRRGRTATETTASSLQWSQPVAVLIDSGTASMGEILAAALQEQGMAPLIGATTAGSVAGSLVVPLSDGSALQVTTLRIDSGHGRVLNRIGVEPDMEVDPTPSAADAALDAAMSYLRNQVRARDGQSPQSGVPDALPDQQTVPHGQPGGRASLWA